MFWGMKMLGVGLWWGLPDLDLMGVGEVWRNFFGWEFEFVLIL